jgi:hypothetical protein
VKRALPAATLAMIVAAGCAAADPLPSADASAAMATPSSDSSLAVESVASVLASPSPGATSTPSTTEPVGEPPASAPPMPAGLQRVAVIERDGIRARMELQRNPLVAGERNWIKTSVRNTGPDNVTWFHDGCAQPIYVHGTSDTAWPPGATQSGQALEFKILALGMSWATDAMPAPVLDFVPKRILGRGSFGCADIGISEVIGPGEAVELTLWWTGYASVMQGRPPSGPATIHGDAQFYWRGPGEPKQITKHHMKLDLDAWVVDGLPDGRLTPPEVADAALADAEFASFIEDQRLRIGREEILWYDPDAGVWEVGVMPWYETKPPRIHGVVVDPVSGSILGRLDRAWDNEVDPFP